MSNNMGNNRAQQLINWFRQYASLHLDSQQADEQRLYPPHVLLDLGEQGFFGMHISEAYGGLELSTADMLRVVEQVAAIDLTLAVILVESIQGAHTVEKYASDAMKKEYLPLMAKGMVFTSGAMTESEAGSNPRAMKSFATPDGHGNWLINGGKRWVGMAASARILAVYVQQFDENDTWEGMSGFLVTRDAEGLSIGQDTATMGIRGFSKNTVTLTDVKVETKDVLGKPGQGMEIAQDNMMYIRLCLAAATTGAMKRCIQLMHRYAERRTIATGILKDNPVTLVLLDRLTAMTDAVDAYVYTIARLYDTAPELVPEEALVISKIIGSEYLGKVVDSALQLLGARGYEDTCEISKLYRDARCFRIFEGPTEALNMYLGARVVEKNNKLERFFCDTLGQKDLYHSMCHAIEQTRHACETLESPLFVESFSRHYWEQSLAGEIVSYGLLLAGLTFAAKSNPANELHRAISLVQKSYATAVHNAITLSGELMTHFQPDAIERSLASYSHTIGNVDQTRRGMHFSIDDLLKKNATKDQSNQFTRKHHEFFTAKETGDICVREPLSALSNNGKPVKHKAKETNGAAKHYQPVSVCQLFEQQVALHPKDVALVFQDDSLTYAELNDKANRVATYLKAELGGKNATVALYFERSINQIVAMLGILKAGCAYLPLDFNYPEKQLAYMLEDSGSSLILSTKHLANDFPFDSMKTVFIEDAFEKAPASAALSSVDVPLNATGYVLYTSGSTGQPKGVEMPHQALTNLIQWHLDYIDGKRDVLQFTTVNFDMSFMEIFGALCSGGRLILISESDRLNLERFSETVAHNKVEQLVLSVPYLKILANSKSDKKGFEHVKEIVVAGEQILVTPALVSLFDQLPNARLLNYYGPSETHVVTAYTFPRKTANWPEYPPIGEPIPNTDIYVLDEALKPVSPGEIGELFIGGVCLADGYRNLPALTESRFIAHPWAKQPGEKLYRSGDIGKYLPDGNLVYLGRKDDQVKIRGYRIEPQEIEWHLLKYTGVKQAAVIAKKNSHTDRHLEAFVVLDGKESDQFVNNIYSFLQQHLPPHMLPSAFNIVDAMPLTNSGKIDRIALEKTENGVIYSVNTVDVPVTETEKVMIDVIQSVFKMRVGVNNSFYSIGGNSLLAIHILSKLKEHFSVEIPAFSILSDPSIAHTAKRIDKLLNGGAHSV